MDKINIKNQKGQQIIEVLIALFLVGFFISGLMGFYQYTGDFQEITDSMTAERHFTFIQNVLSENCDSFIGDKLTVATYENSNPLNDKNDLSIPEITKKNRKGNHKLLYAPSNVAGHILSSDTDKNIAIKEMTLVKENASDKHAIFTMISQSLKTFTEHKKSLKLYTEIDLSTNKITDCSFKPFLSCKADTVEIDYVWEEKDTSGVIKKKSCYNGSTTTSRNKGEVPDLLSADGLWESGTTINVTDTSSNCCICMIQLQCNEGNWFKLSSCFKRKGNCLSAP
ncbi:MAG: hypothetical protein OXC37_00495 [Bdellovibrionaceae bacterium]|nr:hypothetical protein [Pseudobdellovibrionaceae bacterium]